MKKKIFILVLVVFGIALLFIANKFLNKNIGNYNLPTPTEKFKTGEEISFKLSEKENLEFVWVEALQMWVGKYETTLGQYEVFNQGVAHSGWKTYIDEKYINKSLSAEEQKQMRQHPVLMIGWNEAKTYCKELNKRFINYLPKGYIFRLPVEKEWETFARCGDNRLYPWGNEWPPKPMADGVSPNLDGNRIYCAKPWECNSFVTWYEDGWKTSCPVQKSGMNEWGIYGVAGNAEEWCEDWYKGKVYRENRLRLLKGSTWRTDNRPYFCKISYRGAVETSSWYVPVLSWFNNKVKKNRGHSVTGIRVVIGKKYIVGEKVANVKETKITLEGKALINLIRTCERLYFAENKGYYTDKWEDISGAVDMSGNKYFITHPKLTVSGEGKSATFTATVTGSGKAEGISVSIDQNGNITVTK